MSPTATALLALVATAAVVDWWAIVEERPSFAFIAKPLVMIGLVGSALAVDVSDGVVRGLVVAALGASLVGDVVLTTPDARFEAGALAFLVARVLYIGAFVESGGLEVGAALSAGVLIVGIGFGAVPQLLAGALSQSRFAYVGVGLYTMAAAAMATLAAATTDSVAVVSGALLLASDALLGWTRYVADAPGGRVLVHITYHLGQIGIVLWLAA